ncbi:hypothetical protein [Streptomyces lavendulae]|uniref:hypothetical protein n=1 Tax=Streptomyces lavendulae TaxID=1914 RepID=UPI0024A0E0AF|nr:hypothetical protein Sros01_14860 [Streptomyces roseochromogenus]
MIPATQSHEARYKHTTEHPNGTTTAHYTSKRVVAWDNDGHPLVVGRDNTLCRASSWGNYHDVDLSAARVVAVIPGAGWRGEYKNDDGEVFTWPITAWSISADGHCTPLAVDALGDTDDARDSENFLRLIPPGDS